MSSDGPHDGPLCEDFVIANTIEEERSLRALHAWFETAGEPRVTEEAESLFTDLDVDLSKMEREAVIVGLLSNQAIEQVGARGDLISATYRFDVLRSRRVLEQQRIAHRAFASRRDAARPRTDVTTLVTVPAGADIARLDRPRVAPLAPRLRRLLLEAQESVRIANPYFDPDQHIVGDILALPRKGARTRILTREIDSPDNRAVLDRMSEELSDEELRNLDIAELYDLTDTGQQLRATHAKLLIVDEELAYVGSANLTMTSMRSNFEVGLVVEGPAVDDLVAVYDQAFEAGRPVGLPLG